MWLYLIRRLGSEELGGRMMTFYWAATQHTLYAVPGRLSDRDIQAARKMISADPDAHRLSPQPLPYYVWLEIRGRIGHICHTEIGGALGEQLLEQWEHDYPVTFGPFPAQAAFTVS